MRRFRRGARPRRTRCGTVREGNEAGADAAALECRDLREWPPGDRSADSRIHRESSDEARTPSEDAEAGHNAPYRGTIGGALHPFEGGAEEAGMVRIHAHTILTPMLLS